MPCSHFFLFLKFCFRFSFTYVFCFSHFSFFDPACVFRACVREYLTLFFLSIPFACTRGVMMVQRHTVFVSRFDFFLKLALRKSRQAPPVGVSKNKEYCTASPTSFSFLKEIEPHTRMPSIALVISILSEHAVACSSSMGIIILLLMPPTVALHCFWFPSFFFLSTSLLQ